MFRMKFFESQWFKISARNRASESCQKWSDKIMFDRFYFRPTREEVGRSMRFLFCLFFYFVLSLLYIMLPIVPNQIENRYVVVSFFLTLCMLLPVCSFSKPFTLKCVYQYLFHESFVFVLVCSMFTSKRSHSAFFFRVLFLDSVWQCFEHAFLLSTDMTIHNDE